MSKEQAKQIILQALASIRLTLQEHKALQEAVEILSSNKED